MSCDKKTDDMGLNDWLELQEQAIRHCRLMKQLVINHAEDQQLSVQAGGANNDVWDPQELVPNGQANKMAASSH
jgi:hypothetical protein